jgi:diguanylate cyclase (GGDEF)-like protein
VNRNLRNRVMVGLLLSAALLLSVGIFVMRGARQFVSSSNWVEHTHDVLNALEHVYATVKDVEADQRGFLLTGKVELEQEYLANLPAARAAVDDLAKLVADNPAQAANATRLRELVEKRLQASLETYTTYKTSGFDQARTRVAGGPGIALMSQIRDLHKAMATQERELLAERMQLSEASARMLELSTLVGLGVGLVLFGLVAQRLLVEVRERQRAEIQIAGANAELTKIIDELALREDHTRQLSRYAGMLQSCRSVDEAVEVSRQAISGLLPDCSGSVYLTRPSQDLAECIGSWGQPAASTAALFPPQDCWALRRGQPFEAEDIVKHVHCAHVNAVDGNSAWSICVPLVAHGEMLGLLNFSCGDCPPASQRDVMIAAVEQLSLALSNLRLQDSLRTQSIRDPLTGLYNRRYLEESLTRELARCDRLNKPVSVLMVDLDHFKRFNDTHGHDGGDALLTHAGRLLQAHCRAEDIACRFGGEEFTVILPEVDAERAGARAEQIRTAIESLDVRHLRERLSSVTTSIGVATFPASATEADELLRRADAALYRAKKQGRNRVVFDQDEPTRLTPRVAEAGSSITTGSQMAAR